MGSGGLAREESEAAAQDVTERVDEKVVVLCHRRFGQLFQQDDGFFALARRDTLAVLLKFSEKVAHGVPSAS